MKADQIQKRHWFKSWLVVGGSLCMVVLASKAVAATMVEYALLLVAVLLLAATAPAINDEPWHVVGDQLQMAAQAARDAALNGDRQEEIAETWQNHRGGEGSDGHDFGLRHVRRRKR